ncbi:MAG: hypothetical protein JKY01_00925 [Pseudomonadales bacterium]|nr:hypothetical protein [Pseudomonadales bacterium]
MNIFQVLGFKVSVRVVLAFIVVFLARAALASGVECDDPNAAMRGTPDIEMDGFFMGARACLYDPEFVSSDEVPVIGSDYGFSGSPIFVINGANTTAEHNDVRLRSIAIIKKRPVIGIFNAPTFNVVHELFKFVDKNNKPAMTLRREAFRRISGGRRISVVGMSQSGFMVGRGLAQLSKDLHALYPFNFLRRRKLLKMVDVETLGAIGIYYPNGPNYVHYVNKRDIVPNSSGVMARPAHPGRGSVIATFYYQNEDCVFGRLPLNEYPGENAELSSDLPAIVSPSVHSLCSYSVTGMDFELMRDFAPRFGHAIVPLDVINP